MFTFNIVKKIGDGSYLREGRFIIERIRKERALNMDRTRVDGTRFKSRIFIKNGKNKPS